MSRIWLNVKLINSSLVWAAAGVAVVLVLLALLLEPWHFVERAELYHIQSIYEYMFPLVAVFMMSQLFAEELQPDVAGWLMSLPFRSWKLLLGRWLLGMAMLALLYLGGILIIHYCVLPISLPALSYQVLPPALWLGQLAMLGSIAGRSYAVGLGIPLFYWVLETLTAGVFTRRLYLFAGKMPEYAEWVWNRNMLLALSGLALLLSLLIFSRRSYFIR
ncbi:hypothetical protein K0T92_16145 [Paenibacillus oenotherae]|uniref:ABC-2 family transporter protein n=1 Tax=Paenibacillus oenotherae TaxID=1435645 RepID=A0ABS7D8K8_9BACL|nr:hypothetical protein [Paenibacillus oenotherae]MBW7476268.1 hypothetical protein [Paenibacillus oenotherae]